MKIKIALLAAAMMLSPIAYAEWTVTHDKMQNKWAVSDGTQNPIFFNNKKNAEKAAKAINKAEAKDKKEDGKGREK